MDGNVVVLQIKTGAYFVLNTVGSRVWKLALEGRTAEEMVEALDGMYDIPASVLEKDILHFLRLNLEKGLLAYA